MGLTVVTDGEYRRRFFFSTIEVLYDGIDPTGFIRHHQDFEGVQHELRTPTPVARLSRRALAGRLRARVRALAHRRLVKVTLPCPSMFPNYWSDGVSEQAYPDRDAYLEHLVELMNEDAKALAAAGADYIQLDAPHYAYIQKVMSGVEDRDATLRQLIDMRQPGARRRRRRDHRAPHLPRQRPQPFHRNRAVRRVRGVDLPAHVAAERLLLEYDDERSGGFEPLRWARDDQMVVLGLVTTKRSEMESRGRAEAAHRGGERVRPARAPGALDAVRIRLERRGQRRSPTRRSARKLELVVEVATDVWGTA